MSEWIKIEDRLPEMRADVIAVDKHGDIAIGYFYYGYKEKLCFADPGDNVPFPTHWQSLPALPGDQGKPAPVLHFVFDRIPDEKGCTFIEVEDASGASINAGRWEVRSDGLAQLVVEFGRKGVQLSPEAIHGFMMIEDTSLMPGEMKFVRPAPFSMCHECLGSGKDSHSITHKTTGPCKACNGTGRKP